MSREWWFRVRAAAANKFSDLLLVLATALLYWITGKIGLLTAIPPGVATSIWPPSGLALASLLLFGPRAVLGIWLGSFFVNVGTTGILVAILIAAGSTLQAWIGASVLLHLVGPYPFLRVHSVFAYIAVSAVSCLTAATVGPLTLIVAGQIPWSEFARTWATWWVGDFVGILVVGSSLLILFTRAASDWKSLRKIECAVLITLLFIAGCVQFGNLFDVGGHFPTEYLLIPLMVWAAVRFGQTAIALAILVMATPAIWGTLHGFGPFVRPESSESLILLQLYLGTVTGLGLIVSALTCERIEAEAELRRSNRDLEQFAYLVSHDLKEPLRGVNAFIGLLNEKHRGKDAQSDEFLQFALEGTRRMRALIDGMLAYSLAASKPREPKTVDTKEIVQQALGNLRALRDETDAKIIHGDLPTVRGDELQLVLLFQNLISNAMKYRRQDVVPEVRIECRRASGYWHFTVEDNGVGIAPQDRLRVFELFQRAASASQPGAGIGLAGCKKIIENHNGRIWIDEARAGGAAFQFTLPV